MLASLQRAYRKLRYGAPIIVISGLPRSGTSMAMKMLDAAGFATVTDGLRTADEDNPKGYYEDERVKNLAQMTDKAWVADARGKVIKVISHLLKELPASNNYKVLFMDRTLTEVLASQAKMLNRRGESSETPDERMIELFQDDVWRAKYRMRKESQFEFVELHYTDVLQSPREQAQRIAKFLGGDLDIDRMAAVVDPSLYRNRADKLAATP